MANVNDHKTVAAPFSNKEEIVRVIYDFAEDAGATGALNLITADGDLVITDFWARGITVLDSSGDGASIDVGVVGGNTDVFLDGVAEATFAADAIIQPTTVEGTPNVLACPVLLADGGSIAMTIVTEALTSGKCEFVFKIARFK